MIYIPCLVLIQTDTVLKQQRSKSVEQYMSTAEDQSSSGVVVGRGAVVSAQLHNNTGTGGQASLITWRSK